MNLPLNDQDFAQIRSNVMREIARRQKRSSWLLAGAVAFAVLAMVFVLVPRREPVQIRAGRIAGATQRPATRISVAPAILPAATVATTQIEPVKHHHKHHRARRPQPIAIASSEQSPITIELHTANPDVRIIWIAK